MATPCFPLQDRSRCRVPNLALERNDPNLASEVLEKENQSPRNVSYRQRQTYRTEISDDEENGRKSLTRDPSRWCVQHETPPPLAKCRALRGKSLEDRKNLLKKNRICFPCVASTTHFAKDCRNTTKCWECQNVKHLTAMHAGKPLEPKKPAEDPNGDNDQSQHPPMQALAGRTKPQRSAPGCAATKSVDDHVLKYA